MKYIAIKLFSTTILASVISLWSVTSHANNNTIVIGSGGLTGVYYPVAVSICRLFNAQNSSQGFGCEVETTGGSVDNLKRLRSGAVNFAIVQSDWQSHSYNGTGVFANVGPHKELRSLFTLYSESFTVLARSNTGITKIDDVFGHGVNIGNKGSGQRATMEIVMKALGWNKFDFSHVREFTSDHQAQALCDGEVDVIVFVTGHPSGSIKSATEKCETNLVDVSGTEIEQLIKEFNYYRKVQIPPGLYRGQTSDVSTFGLSATMITSSENTSKELIDRFLSTIYGNIDRVRRMHPALQGLKIDDMKNDAMPAPLHSVAKKYYAESLN